MSSKTPEENEEDIFEKSELDTLTVHEEDLDWEDSLPDVPDEDDSTDVAPRGGTGQSSTDTDLQMGNETVERLRSRQEELETVAESDLPAQRIATELLSILQQQNQST